ncbi:MAG: hypothetical protein BGN93_11185 [Acinetobacter sp. 39-4]|nr:MAG: hypothetical protein BGN93_11185 [Acinetobacter sp. 39-4]OJU96523.1 MAG: hypothetical protein BGO19_17565 [Acinetobacter sp. 38-8]
MFDLNEQDIMLITKLNPLEESKFKYDVDRWSELHQNLKNIITKFENLYISRQDVINGFRQYYSQEVGIEFPFVLTMIWGFADIGYGTYRTNKYYNNIQNMQLAFDYVKEDNIHKAYQELKKIEGLSISYISKLLYFSTRALNRTTYCLIFDVRVARALITLSCGTDILNIVDVKPSDKFKDYHQYNEEMHILSQRYKISAEALEMYLFQYLN